jgi:hypothetical protein
MLGFGVRAHTQVLGPLVALQCPQCKGAATTYQYVVTRRWFTVFFVPILPLSEATREMVCPTCNRTVTLTATSPPVIDIMVAITAAYFDDKLSSEDYASKSREFLDAVNTSHSPSTTIDAPPEAVP